MTVEVMRVGQVVLVQDSRRPAAAGGQLQAWALLEWAELLRAVRLGEHHPAVDVDGDGTVTLGLRFPADRHELLVFAAVEWRAFVDGATHGEFELDALDVPARCEASSSAIRVGPEEEEAGAVLRGGAPAEVAAGVCGVGAVTPAPVAADSDSPAGRDLSREAVEGSPDAVATTGQPGSSCGCTEMMADGMRAFLRSLLSTEDPPAGRPRDASTGEVVLSPADRPGSDAAGTGLPPGSVPAVGLIQHEGWDRSLGMRCGRCGQYTGNNHQGHHWSYCSVTGQRETLHFCCPGDCDRASAWREQYEVLAERLRDLGVEPDMNNAFGVRIKTDERWLALVAAARAIDNDAEAWAKAVAPLVPTDGAS